MDLEIILPREVRKTNTFDITYMWNLKDDSGEHIHDTDCREQTSVADREENNRQLGLRRGKPHTGWISNGVLLCSTGSHIH